MMDQTAYEKYRDKYRQQTRLVDEAEMALILQERYHSGEWWFFLPANIGAGFQLLAALEARFYDGVRNGRDKNDDYDCLCRYVPATGEVFALGLGHKRHLPPARLRKFLRRQGRTLTGTATADVLVLAAGSSRARAERALGRLTRLLTATIIDPSLN